MSGVTRPPCAQHYFYIHLHREGIATDEIEAKLEQFSREGWTELEYEAEEDIEKVDKSYKQLTYTITGLKLTCRCHKPETKRRRRTKGD